MKMGVIGSPIFRSDLPLRVQMGGCPLKNFSPISTVIGLSKAEQNVALGELPIYMSSSHDVMPLTCQNLS